MSESSPRWTEKHGASKTGKHVVKDTPEVVNDKENITSVDVQKSGSQLEGKDVFHNLIVGNNDDDNILKRLRHRFDRMSVELPKIEIRYEHLSVEGDVHVGSRALPTLFNATINSIETILRVAGLASSKKRKVKILHNVSGIVRPSRMTLLLGPPSSGKTTLLLALAGKLDESDVKVTGNITYCGHELNEFVIKKTCAYVSQNNLHHGEMTVRETLDFASRCLGVGTKYELLEQLLEREKQAGIKSDPEIDAYMKGVALNSTHETSLVIEYVLKILGLDICANTIVGDDMRRGISGGEIKRLTIGEVLVGPAKVLMMDEISTGLDSATTFHICKYISELVHTMDMTTVISLLQPTPQVYELFDDIILLSEGEIVYQGPRDHVLDFFEFVGFKCPKRKEVANFLQEVTSKKDQRQYWSKDQIYTYVSVPELVQAFETFEVGEKLASELRVPYLKAKTHPLALAKDNYSISNKELLKACFSREWLLMKRNSFFYIFKSVHVVILSIVTMTAFFRTTMHHETVEDGMKYLSAIFMSMSNFVLNGMAETTITVMGLPIFYRQRDSLFYPTWAYALPIWVLRIPVSCFESALWTILTYYTIGYAPGASRFFSQWLAYFSIHQMALSFFRSISALGRTIVVATTICMILLLFFFVLSGFIIAKGDISPWMIWAYYLSPMMYGQHALIINEFLDKRWNIPNEDHRFKEPTIGKVILTSRDLFTEPQWFWISIGALTGFSFLSNLIYVVALRYLNPLVQSKAIAQNHGEVPLHMTSFGEELDSTNFVIPNEPMSNNSAMMKANRGMILAFRPLSIAFNHINYYVDTPSEMKSLGYEGDRLQLLRNVSGAFRPGILTALVGVTGAGKTTLIDVLAGKKTRGYIEGTISVSGHPKNQTTFARISGYCEQIDIHSPHLTIYESLLYSAWLRLPSNIDLKTRTLFIEEVMRLIELEPIRDAIVGLPGTNGLSIEQRKRLTIAVELVANPSIIFMDEPTSGLDARAAAIVMRTMKNIVNTGRTIVCTIHQPSMDIFEAFDELMLMKRGGQIIYAGPLGDRSYKLIEYFEAIHGVPKIREGYNPATWMLEVTSPQAESQMDLDYAKIYEKSELYQRNQDIIRELSTPAPDSKDLYFKTKYSQPFFVQFKACLWKQYRSYWQNPTYTGVRFFMAILMGALVGLIFWNKGGKLTTLQDMMNLLGVIYAPIMFLGASNALNVQIVVATERTVFYRERAAIMYSTLPFALAQLVIETIYLAIVNLIYVLLLYSMIGYEWTIGKFLYFYYFIFMCFTYHTALGMMLVSLTPRHEIASVFMTLFATFWNLFAGFFLPRPQIPIWWRWSYWTSPVAWTMYGLVTSQVGDKSSLIEIPGISSVPVKIFLKELLGYEYDFLPVVVVAHLAWVLLFFMVFAYSIKFFNFQKR